MFIALKKDVYVHPMNKQLKIILINNKGAAMNTMKRKIMVVYTNKLWN